MSWVVIVVLGVGSYLLRLLGLALLGDREMPPWIVLALKLVPVSLLAALIAVQALGGPDGGYLVDARITGVLAASVAVALRAPFLAVVVVAVAVTAGTRALGWG